MIKITLKDGFVKEVESGISVIELAGQISEGLARVATAGKINGEVVDLRTTIENDANVEILTFENDIEGKKAYWHTTSHIMAQAVKRLYGDSVKLAIGPSIDEGFYYDFDSDDKKISQVDFEAIEAEMKKIIKENLEISRFELPRNEAIELAKKLKEPYKVELINDLPEDEVISFYKQGEFTDLCAGPHLMSTGKVKIVKLLKVAGAYWRGSEKNKMLQRVYAISFPKQSMLDEYLQKLEEAKERDHRKLGKELGIFMTSDLVGKGFPMWLPNGFLLRRALSDYIMDKELKLGYKHVLTPSLGSVDLYKTSGHWDHYKDDMFPVMEMDNEAYVLRPMNCPHHMMIYKNFLHSYHDLPLRMAEVAHDFRFEDSGTLVGLERARCFTQNDSHIFCRPDQIKDEFKAVIELILDTYKDFGFKNYKFRLSLRDPENKEKYFDNDELWNKSENELREVLIELGVDFYEAKGEAAFYGPKLDVQVISALGHDVTLSTCQLDYQLPEKFELEYVDENGDKVRPVVVHRAILGSLDRFVAFLLEETKGNLPVWLAPVQVKVLPISDKFIDEAKRVYEACFNADLKVELDDRAEKIGYKIREAQTQKIPYMLIVGAKEVETNTVSIRKRSEGEIGSLSIEDTVAKIKQEIENKSL
ncbi:MAG: threonine--tRNA ligase [Clostridiales bacterium]|jgi:threonine--tRNA ligase|nr:threonine--tRNA ligase [Clostridiales bacterium]